MKATCLLLSADQKRYSFLFKQLSDGDNVGSDEYPVTMTSTLDLLIQTKCDIHGNQQFTHENCGGRGERHPKGCTGHTFAQQRKEDTEENSTLVPGIDGNILNTTCYNCHKMVHLA